MGKSHQRGWVVLRGRKWYGYYRRTVFDPIKNQQHANVVPVILDPKSQLTKFQARERLEQEITKQTRRDSGTTVMNDSSVTFAWFVRSRFFPLKEANWKPETAKVKKLIIQKYLRTSVLLPFVSWTFVPSIGLAVELRRVPLPLPATLAPHGIAQITFPQ